MDFGAFNKFVALFVCPPKGKAVGFAFSQNKFFFGGAYFPPKSKAIGFAFSQNKSISGIAYFPPKSKAIAFPFSQNTPICEKAKPIALPFGGKQASPKIDLFHEKSKAYSLTFW